MTAPTVVDDTLAALADPTRRGVIELLRQQPRKAGDLAQALGMSPPAMSRHLRILRTGGLIEEERQPQDARIRVYRLRPERFHGLQEWLDEVASFWSDQLDAFRAHAERDVSAPSDADVSAQPDEEKVR